MGVNKHDHNRKAAASHEIAALETARPLFSFIDKTGLLQPYHLFIRSFFRYVRAAADGSADGLFVLVVICYNPPTPRYL